MKEAEGGDTVEKQLRVIEAIRLVLLRAEAARALSWLWPSNSIPCTSHAAGATAVQAKVNSTDSKPLAGFSSILRLSPVRHRVLSTFLSRWVVSSILVSLYDARCMCVLGAAFQRMCASDVRLLFSQIFDDVV